MYGLSLESEYCPDGVELFDYGPRKKKKMRAMGRRIGVQVEREISVGPEGKTFRCRSSCRYPFRLGIDDLENSLVVRLINAKDDDARAQFFGRFGFLDKCNTECPRQDVLEDQRNLRKLLALAGSGQTEEAAKAINKQIGGRSGLGLMPVLVGKQPTLNLQSLYSLMLMELMTIVGKDARLTSCGHCEVAFLTGPTTGRRSHARYCRDSCRVAAMRARNAA